MSIYIKDVTKNYQGFRALEEINLNIKQGELVALLGPSGSGKTTLLRIIAGLESPDSGEIFVNNENALDKPLSEREVGFVFQHYALFKHMTVFENVAFGLRVRAKKAKLSKKHIEEKVTKLLDLVQLEKFAGSYPRTLSGGQRQRVALARSLAVEPEILLLDEPFGALDSKVRQQLRRWLRKLHDEIPITTIFVTHDQEEAMEVADRVVVMSEGGIEQIGTPEQIYHHPANAFVYDFLGNFNMFEGRRDENGVTHIAGYDLEEQNLSKKIKESMNEIDWFDEESQMINLVKKFLPKSMMKFLIKKQISKNRQIRKEEKQRKIKIFARPHEMELVRKPTDGGFMEVKIMHINGASALVKLEGERKDGQVIQIEISKENFDILQPIKGEFLFTRPTKTRVFE